MQAWFCFVKWLHAFRLLHIDYFYTACVNLHEHLELKNLPLRLSITSVADISAFSLVCSTKAFSRVEKKAVNADHKVHRVSRTKQKHLYLVPLPGPVIMFADFCLNAVFAACFFNFKIYLFMIQAILCWQLQEETTGGRRGWNVMTVILYFCILFV